MPPFEVPAPPLPPPLTPARPRFPARVGAVLATPRRALAALDANGAGGVADALVLVALGTVCFRLPGLARALLALGEQPLLAALGQLLGVFSREAMDAATVVLPAALAVTVFAGRGRRDPARDLELASAAFVPVFALRSLFRLANAGAFDLPLSRHVGTFVNGAAWALAGLWTLFAIGVARRRLPDGAPHALPDGPPHPGTLRARLAVTTLAALLGVGFFAELVWVADHVDSVRPLRRGGPAPSFVLPRADPATGPPVGLDQLRGRVVVLDFWATWCPPCVAMLPTMHALSDEWAPQGVAFVGVNAEGTADPASDVRAFLREHAAPYPIVIDDGRAQDLYKVQALPQLVLIGRDGSVLRTFTGLQTRSTLSDAIAQAVAQTVAGR